MSAAWRSVAATPAADSPLAPSTTATSQLDRPAAAVGGPSVRRGNARQQQIGAIARAGRSNVIRNRERDAGLIRREPHEQRGRSLVLVDMVSRPGGPGNRFDPEPVQYC